jgi:hypothetical protein
MLCAGVFLIMATFPGLAEEIHATAKVSAPSVTDLAVISSPVDGQHFAATPIPVSGSCPLNAGYVEIFSNGVMKGTAICDVSSQFNLSIDLFAGANSLVAHVFNITDDEGPVSAAVQVIYDPPQPPPITVPPSNSHPPAKTPPSSSAKSPLVIQTAFVYKGYYTGDEVQWPIQISGGKAPYKISVDWGDGTIDELSQAAAGSFDIKHIYHQPGGYKDAYTIKVAAKDAAGSSAYLQFFVIIVDNQGQITPGNIFSKPPPSFGRELSWLWLAWPAYIALIVMVVSFWLGEREEIIVLRKKGLLKHVRHV